MNTKINNKRRRSSSHYFIFSFIFLFSIIAHQFYKQYLYSLSNDYVQIIQNEIKVRCPFYKTIFFLFSYIVNYKVLILAIIVFMYNFGNIFKTYILLLTLEIAMISSSVFKLIYREYKPYWNFFINDTKSNVTYINIANTTELYSTNKTNDVFYISTNGFGGPSTNVLITAVLLFTVWRVIFKSMRLKEKGCFYKNIVLFIVFIYTLIESFLYWICYESSLDQIAFSFSLAFCIYFFIFYVLNLYSNDMKQIFKTLIFPIYYKCLIYIGVLTMFTIFYFTIRNIFGEENELVYQKVLQSIHYNNSSIIIQSLFSEAYYSFCIFFLNLGLIFGMRQEYFSLFEGSFNNWTQYNFEKDEEIKEDEDESLMSKLSINKDIQWNHTKIYYSIPRLVILLILMGISSLSYTLISFDSNVIMIILLKYFLCLNLISFGMFYGYKQILKYLKLTNILIFTMLRESI